MPAGLPGSTLAQNQGNPTLGKAVIMDPLSGPKGTPFDARVIDSWLDGSPVYAADPLNVSTGGLCTGIGFGSPPIFGDTAVGGFAEGNFTDDYIPGVDLPVGTTATDSKMVYIGGGRSDPDGTPDPYLATDVGICMAGNGSSRDAGTAGFPVKTVTAAGTVANGAAVETGFANRSGVSIVAGQSVFGSATASNTTPA
jgi:hypothetical protein